MKNILKKKTFAAFCAAVMITATGTTGVNVYRNAHIGAGITASAAESYEMTVSARKYGLVTPAEAVLIRRGNIEIKKLDWDSFVKGYSFKAQSDTTVEITYNDGVLVFNAYTGELISNTRKCGISREKFYVDGNSFTTYEKDGTYPLAENGLTNGTNSALFVLSTKRNANGTSYIYKNSDSVAGYYSTYEILNGLEFDYTEGTDIYFIFHLGNEAHQSVVKYDIVSGKVISKSYYSKTMNNIPVEAAMFPNEKGYSKAEVTTNFLDGSQHLFTDSEGIVIDEDGDMKAEKIMFTEDEIKEGTSVIWQNTGFSPSSEHYLDLYGYLRIKFFYDNGDYAEYALIGDKAVVLESQRYIEPVYNSNNELVTDIYDNPIYKGTDENGNPVVSNETLGLEEKDYNYTVEVYEGSKIIRQLDKIDFELTDYRIGNYNADKHYYVRVLLENGQDSIYYRFYPEISGWVKRIETSETPAANCQISPVSFPTEYAACNVAYSGKNIMNCTADEFAKGSKFFTMITGNCMDYTVTFESEKEAPVYTYIGIDAEPFNDAAPSETLCSRGELTSITIKPSETNLPYSIDKPVYHIKGSTESGKQIEGDAFPVLNDGTSFIELPDGTYDITDAKSGLTETIIVDHDNNRTPVDNESDTVINSDENTEIVISPKDIFEYTVKSPDGKIVAEGNVADGDFDTADDIDSDMTVFPYFEYETVKGIGNSSDPDDIVRKSGYAVITSDDSIEFKSVIKGDVNLDGKVNVSDLVTAQKYLLNALDEKETYTIDSFIAFDVCPDGRNDVFDMIAERHIVAESMSDNK